MNILRLLNSIGKENFIIFYHDYEKYYLSDNKKVDKEILAQKFLAEKILKNYRR